MDFEKVVIIGVNPQHMQDPPESHHIFAEVVLIDKSTDALRPLLYQLNEQKNNLEESLNNKGLISTEKNAFMMVGEVLSIDKKKKQIYLSNQNTVSYKHLIVANDDEFSHGLHALIDALRIKDKLPEFNSYQANHKMNSKLKYTLFENATLTDFSKYIASNSDKQQTNEEFVNKPLFNIQLNN